MDLTTYENGCSKPVGFIKCRELLDGVTLAHSLTDTRDNF